MEGTAEGDSRRVLEGEERESSAVEEQEERESAVAAEGEEEEESGVDEGTAESESTAAKGNTAAGTVRERKTATVKRETENESEETQEKEVWLLTGGTGLIGTRVAAFLASQMEAKPWIRLRVLVRNSSDTSRLAGECTAAFLSRQLEVARTDLEVPHLLRKVFTPDVTYVYHVAAKGGDWGVEEEFYLSNELATANLVRFASELPRLKRFLHVSTVDVYPHIAPADCHEWVPPQRTSRYHYSRTKAAAEYIVTAADLPWTIVRPAVVYGPHSYTWGLQEAMLLHRGRGVTVAGARCRSGAAYVDDVARAIIMAAQSEVSLCRRYNVSNPESCSTWRQFYDDIADGIGAQRAKISVPYWLAWVCAWLMEFFYRLFGWDDNRPLLTFFLLRLVANDQDWPIDAARRDFGWRPEVSHEEGIKRTVEWLQRSKIYLEDGYLHW
eukprot:CAMPEP_0114616168 /NCGR_PEP_ID=MMETSP0168-20121206/6548_1 /TAXON_ID=95228 ORGANISM="Vannella sp., Strain DIVA3 517/6/12" /NCGR_SAMPLE_ID=MMETSP0168 /ASSEMBLY_ACC=CAM_ASM_000044 /LENGTH=439 /DNA_ID=CAMNT_0001827275 /DNA_START=44 /DNA_END=1361 /DNA_ORIENTATION=+